MGLFSIPINELHPRVMPIPFSGCWVWMGKTGGGGYAVVMRPGNKSTAMVHRLSYEQHIGKIPDGLVIDHLCRVRCCVNPHHLEPVTNAENLRRGFGQSALNSRKTNCKNGHPLSGNNLLKNKGRLCRLCSIQYQRKRYAELNAGSTRKRKGMHSSVFTMIEANKIRSRVKSGELRYKIAQEFGVSVATISNMCLGKTYTDEDYHDREKLKSTVSVRDSQ